MTFDPNDLLVLNDVERDRDCVQGFVTDRAGGLIADEGYCSMGDLDITFSGPDAGRYAEAFAALWNAYRAGHLVVSG